MTRSQKPYSADLIKAAEHIAANQFGKAEAILRPYVKDNPADVNGIRLLGEVGIALGALSDGEKLLARAVELAPKYTEARYGWANALYKRHRYEEAREQLDHLLALDSSRLDWRMLKAATLVEVNEYEEAIELFESVLKLRPDHRQAYLSYGHALRAVGRTEDCIVAYEKCVEVATGVGEAYYSLANLKTYRFSDEQIAHIEELLNDSACEFRDYYHLLFSLGKAQEDRGNHQAAMAAYVKGNQVRGKNVPWDSQKFHSDTEELKAFFSDAFFAKYQGNGCDRKDPIFIVGLPRSGSTLIEQILASHSLVEGTAELADIIALARKLSGKAKRGDPSRYPGGLARSSSEEIEGYGQGYIDSTAIQRVTQKPYFIDKMPNNFSHIGLIHLILPNARIIDARRHPLDCCFSGFKQLFASGQGFTYGQRRIGNYYRDYVSLMDHWDAVLPGRVLRVQYEDMVNDTETQVRKILDYCGLPFEESCLEFYNNKRAVRTASSEQVRQPIYASGMGQWQAFEKWLDPLKEALGPVLERYPIERVDS